MDRNGNGGGIIICVQDDVTSKTLTKHKFSDNIEVQWNHAKADTIGAKKIVCFIETVKNLVLGRILTEKGFSSFTLQGL